MKIIVDTYSADERAMGWYAYLDDTLALDGDRYVQGLFSSSDLFLTNRTDEGRR